MCKEHALFGGVGGGGSHTLPSPLTAIKAAPGPTAGHCPGRGCFGLGRAFPHRGAQGGAADTGRERVQPPPPARGGGPVHPLHVQEAQPRHLKGPGPQSAQSTAGLCSGPKHGPPLASAGMRARPHSKLTPPGTNTLSGRGCQRRYAESSPSLLCSPRPGRCPPDPKSGDP